MSKRKFEIDRRRVLFGAGGIAVTLPMLDIFMPRRAHAQSGGPPGGKVYTLWFCQQNGVIQGTSGEPDKFWPTAVGPLSAATMPADRAIGELAAYANKLTVVKGINFPFGNPVGCGHSSGCNQTLTAAKMKGSVNRSTPVSESADVRLGRELGRDPLNLYAGRKDSYLGDALTYGAGGSVRSADNNPANIFRRLTGIAGMNPMPGTPGTNPPVGPGMEDPLVKLALRRKSRNDILRAQMQQLLRRTDLSKLDRERLDLHFTSIRDMEVRLPPVMGMPTPTPMGPAPSTAELEKAVAEYATGKTFETSEKMVDVMNLMVDMVAFAFASDRAQVATIQAGGGNDHTQYTVTVPGLMNGQPFRAPPFHFVSHRVMNDGASGPKIDGAVEIHHQIDRIHARVFKRALDRLSSYKLPDGASLLDASLATWLNSNADGPPHSVRNVPHVIAGGGRGFLKTGIYVNVGSQPNSRYLNTILSGATGKTIEDFGDPGIAKSILSEIKA
jgi:hypothetical protein